MYMFVVDSHKEQWKTLSQPYPFSRYGYWFTDTNVACIVPTLLKALHMYM